MAQYQLPRSREPQSRLPRLTLPGQSMNAPSGIEGFLNRLPPQMSAGTPTYQAGVDQSTGGEMRAAYGDMRRQEESLRQQQETALEQHKVYREKLQATQQQVNTRNNDLRLAQNLLIATDPSMDKSVRKFMLQGLSNASGVDPKGEYSKKLQEMILSMQPESLEAVRSAFGGDIRKAEPGAIQAQLNGLFSGAIPIENVMGQVKQHQEAKAAAAEALTSPGLPISGANIAGPQVGEPGPDATAAEQAGGATITPASPLPSAAPSAAVPTSPVAQDVGINPADEAARLFQNAMSESSTGSEPPPPPPDFTSPEVTTPPTEEAAAPAAPSTPAEAAATQQATPFSKIEIPDHWREAAEKSGDKLAQDIIAKIDQRNAVIDSSQYTSPPETTGAPAAPADGAGRFAAPGMAGVTPAPAPGVGQQIADALGMKPSGPFRKDYKPDTAPVAPGVAEGAIAATTQDRPVVDPATGQELPAPPETARAGFQQQVSDYNAEIRQNPVLKTPDLQYVKPDEREIGQRPVPPSMANALPGVDPKQTYSFDHLKQMYPLLDDSTKYKEEFAKRAENYKDATREVLDANMDLAKLNNLAQKAGTLGGVDLKLTTPWGNFDIGKITPGTASKLSEGVKNWFQSETKVSNDQFSSVREEASKYAAKQLAGTNLSNEDKGTLTVLLEAAFYRSAVAFARANNNGGKQISDQDMKIGLKMAGDITLTGAQNIALTKANTDRALRTASNEFGQYVGQTNMPPNFDAMSSKDRQTLINRHLDLQKDGDKSPLSPEMFKQLAQAEVDYQSQRKGGPSTDPNRFIQRTGNTEEDYRKAQQQDLSTAQTHKQNVETRAQAAEQRAIESHQLALQKYYDQLAHQARQEAQHRQDKLQAAFQHIGAMIAGSVKGAPSGGGGVGAGGEDASVFRITPAPQRSAPRVGGAPNITRYGGPLKK